MEVGKYKPKGLDEYHYVIKHDGRYASFSGQLLLRECHNIIKRWDEFSFCDFNEDWDSTWLDCETFYILEG